MFTTNNSKTEKKIRVKFLRDSVADKRDWSAGDVGDIPANEARMLAQPANASGIFRGRGPSVLMLSENI
jgi:hypothetical protein